MKKFFTHMSAKLKFILFGGLISLLLLGLSLAQHIDLKELKELSEENFNQNLMVGTFAHSAKYNFSRLDSDLLMALTSKSKEAFQAQIELVDEHLDTYLADLNVIREKIDKDPELLDLLKILDIENGRLTAKINLIRKVHLSEKRSAEFWSEFQDRELIYEHLDEMNDLASQKAYANKIAFEARSGEMLAKSAYSSVAIIGLLLIIFWILIATMINPIYTIIHVFRDIANGNRTRQVYTDGLYLEIGHLAESFNILLNSFNESLMREEAANRSLSQFLASMSHELRTPLNSILGFSSMLLEEDRKSSLTDEEKKWLSNVEASGKHLLNLINDVLDLSKIEAGQFEVNIEEVSLEQTIEQVQSLFSVKSLKSGVRLHFDNVINKPITLKTDEVRLRQVLINLINNALKFTEKGSVEVIVRERGYGAGRSECLFEVRDTGIGIEKKFQSKIFGSFNQASSETNKKYGGTGLGLAISKNLVERLDGQIWFKSEPGVGTSFFFTIPVLSEKALPKVKATEAETQQPKLKKSIAVNTKVEWADLQILVAEDNEMNQEVLKLILKKMGIVNVEIAADGVIALEMAHAKKYDLIFLDMQMPNMGGIETAKRIIQEFSAPPPMVALTANAYKDDQNKCFGAGMSDFVAKPIDKKELRAALERQLGQNKSDTKAS